MGDDGLPHFIHMFHCLIVSRYAFPTARSWR